MQWLVGSRRIASASEVGKWGSVAVWWCWCGAGYVVGVAGYVVGVGRAMWLVWRAMWLV